MFGKPKRVVDKSILAHFRAQRCNACDKMPPNDPAHIKSRGSGGDDIEENLLTLCRKCHTTQHAYGWFRFVVENPHLEQILDEKGWDVTELGVQRRKLF